MELKSEIRFYNPIDVFRRKVVYRNGKTKTLDELNIEDGLIMQFLRLGTYDLEEIENVCKSHNMPIPTEIKICYETKTRKCESQYKYEEVCTAKTGKSSGQVFMEWISELKL